jgi:glycosyltransferase involved in cell wall biosynthesis
MKVLHIIDSGGLYGAEVMLLNLAGEQARLGLEPVIGSIGEPHIVEKPLEAEALRRGLRVEKFRMRPGFNVPGALKVLRFAWREKCDVLHSHGYKGNILFGLIPQIVRKIPLVSTIHGYTSVNGFSRISLYERLDSLSLRFVDAVVLVEQLMRSHPRLKKLSGVKLKVVNNGIPALPDSPVSPLAILTNQQFDYLEKTIVKFCQQGFCIGVVGRLSQEKGLDILMEALSALVAEGRDLRMVIMGEGEQRADLENKAANLGLGERLMMAGYVAGAERYLAHLSLFALPSLTEGLPMVLLEAMAAEVPIVASRVGGIPAVLDEGRVGILVPARDVAALKKGIRSVMDDPCAARQRAARAAERVHAFYTSKAMAEGYIRIYRQVHSRAG